MNKEQAGVMTSKQQNELKLALFFKRVNDTVL